VIVSVPSNDTVDILNSWKRVRTIMGFVATDGKRALTPKKQWEFHFV
jgi:hypothetical protein